MSFFIKNGSSDCEPKRETQFKTQNGQNQIFGRNIRRNIPSRRNIRRNMLPPATFGRRFAGFRPATAVRWPEVVVWWLAVASGGGSVVVAHGSSRLVAGPGWPSHGRAGWSFPITIPVEINEAWKVKAKRDPTILPKGKSQAKYESVTLPDNQPADLGDFEQHLQFSDTETLMGMHRSAYIDMNLDNIDNATTSDIENITLFERFDSHQTDTCQFNKFERFDIEGDDIEGDGINLNEETQENFPSQNHTDLPSILVPSPPLQDEPQNPNEIHEQPPQDHINNQSEEDQHLDSIRSIKIERLMDLPPVALVDGLFPNGNRDMYYPLPLLKQWMKLTQPVHDLPSGIYNCYNKISSVILLIYLTMSLLHLGEASPPHPPARSSSLPKTNNYHDPTTFPFEDHHSGAGSGSLGASIEKGRPDVNNHEIPEHISTLMNNGVNETGVHGEPVAEADVAVTPANSGMRFFLYGHKSWFILFRFNKKRLLSSTRKSGSSLHPVAEEVPLDQTDPNFKLAQLLDNELSPEINDLIVETGPTQTQKVPGPDQPMEQLTASIRMQLKTRFDTPGSAQTESLNQLALGLDRKKDACLFYQTCVLASSDFIKVQQNEPYGNIIISRGAKM
ncbi:hypothetical protein R6Q57_021446 [Mikania cordata]